MATKLTTDARDPKQGMTLAELRDALAEAEGRLADNSIVRATVGIRAQLKRIEIG